MLLLGNFPLTTALRTLLVQVRARLAALDSEGGYTAEAAIVIALLVVAAITALGYITVKIISKAKGLSIQ